MWHVLGVALELILDFADDIGAVLRWSDRNNKLAARVEPPHEQVTAADLKEPASE